MFAVRGTVAIEWHMNALTRSQTDISRTVIAVIASTIHWSIGALAIVASVGRANLSIIAIRIVIALRHCNASERCVATLVLAAGLIHWLKHT
jgi:hypothetical protein